MLRKFIKFGVGGSIAAIVDLFFLWFFTEIVGIYYLFSALLAFIISFLVGFIFQKYITFSSKSKNYFSQGFVFLIFQVVGLAIYISLLWFFVRLYGFNYFYVAIFGKLIIFIWNFSMNHFFNFKK